jgi:hypothetical protein
MQISLKNASVKKIIISGAIQSSSSFSEKAKLYPLILYIYIGYHYRLALFNSYYFWRYSMQKSLKNASFNKIIISGAIQSKLS